MTFYRPAAVLLAALALGSSLPVLAQETQKTEVKTHDSMHDGVATQTTKVVHERKYKTHHAKRILGVKVGHKTRTIKHVRTTTVDSNGNSSTSVKDSH